MVAEKVDEKKNPKKSKTHYDPLATFRTNPRFDTFNCLEDMIFQKYQSQKYITIKKNDNQVEFSHFVRLMRSFSP